ALPALRTVLASAPRQFAVGYLSVIAGTLLAAETLKEAIGAAPPLADDNNYVAVQTVDPASTRNRGSRLGTDPGCRFCGRQSPKLRVWTHRYQQRPRTA
ncbi:MAG TPA: hypothetical protein VFT62_07165, partial [Mycobacteriales bacterium]|nr:hypothetical protein [Mycobacteriales bacterium]